VTGRAAAKAKKALATEVATGNSERPPLAKKSVK
jgi:hypothetical protein